MKKALYLAAFLAIVSGLAGGILAGVYQLTAPIISEQATAAVKANLQKIFPTATEYKVVSFTDDTKLITDVYEAVGSGYAYKVTVTGYKDVISFIVGISNDAKIVGFDVLSINDTPGIGQRVGTEEFSKGVIGKGSTDAISTLSGATISSSAVVKGINAAKAHFNTLKKITDTGSSTADPVVTVTLGTAIKLFDTITATPVGEVTNKVVEGDMTTYTVSSKGYAVLESEHDSNPKPNIIIVKIDTVKKQIVSVTFGEFHDTKNIGDKANSETFLKQYVGLSTTDAAVSVDTVSGATFTSVSVNRAVRAAIESK